MKTVFHPTLPVSQEVVDGEEASWLEQGWLTEQPVEADPDYDQLSATVPAVIAHVGTDQGRIAEALEVERGRGDASRSSLITQLEKLTNQEGSI